MTDTSPATETTGFTTLRVADLRPDTTDSVTVTFDTGEHADRFRFRHGQHVTLRRDFDGVDVRRSYSICTASPDGALTIAIKRVPGGVFSTWATTDLRIGDSIEVMAPSGNFTHDLDPSSARRYNLVAAGSGITHIMSTAATILAHEPGARIALYYLNRNQQSMMLIEQLHDLRDRNLGRIAITFAFSREHSGGDLLAGRPDRQRFDDLIAADLLWADADHAFVCGPLEMINAAHEALVAAGMPDAHVHREVFTAPQQGHVNTAPQEVDESSLVVATGRAKLHGRITEFDLFDGDTVLDAVQRVRPDVPYSCRSGVCSTCQGIMKKGTVEMDVNHGLDADELARGYVLTCQSRPTSDHIDVDFDA